MKQTTIDQGVLKMALVGFQLQRDRIDAAIAKIQAELGQGSARQSTATATASAELKTTGKKRFSVTARKRMAVAQKKRWVELKEKKAEETKKPAPAKQTATPKRPKPVVVASRQQRSAQSKMAKAAPSRKAAVKATPKPKVKKAAARTPKVPTVQPPMVAAEIPGAPVEPTSVPSPESVTA